MDLGDLFKDLVWDNLVKAALGRLFAAFPLLGWGPIGFVIGWVATRLAEELYKVTEEFIDLKLIVLRKQSHRQAFDHAGVVLKIVALDKGIDSPEFKNEREKHKLALSKFGRFAA